MTFKEIATLLNTTFKTRHYTTQRVRAYLSYLEHNHLKVQPRCLETLEYLLDDEMKKEINLFFGKFFSMISRFHDSIREPKCHIPRSIIERDFSFLTSINTIIVAKESLSSKDIHHKIAERFEIMSDHSSKISKSLVTAIGLINRIRKPEHCNKQQRNVARVRYVSSQKLIDTYMPFFEFMRRIFLEEIIFDLYVLEKNT